MKTFFAALLLILSTARAFAQETAEAKSFWSDPINDPMMPVYTITTLVLVVAILTGVVALYLIRVLNMLAVEQEKERARQLGIQYTARPTFWSRFAQTMNDSVPLDMEKDIELDHDYDGIKELDNHLPPWWKMLFYATIGWGAIYIVVYHFSDSLPLQEGEYQNEVALAEEQAQKYLASQPQAQIDENTLAYSEDKTIIEKGKSVFMNNNCGSCHRNDGGGNSIGPNLTDEYWLHGGDVKEVFHTVKTGVVEKGMPAWGKVLSPQDVRDVTFFIMSLQGTKPANAKAPQGELFKSTRLVSDSTSVQASL